MRIALSGLALAAALCLPADRASAFDPNPDWPCVQRKVAHLSWGQMWSGPPLPEGPVWREDDEIAALVPRLAQRRMPMEAVRAALATIDGPDREPRLVALFAGTFEAIDTERARIVAGIERYARKQRALAAHIDALRLEVEALAAEAGPEDHDALDRLEALEDKLTWDTRIYDERRRSLEYVCESPVILEKRAFAIARAIQAEIDAGGQESGAGPAANPEPAAN